MWLMLGIPKLHIFVNTHLMKIQSIENTLATVGKQMGGGGEEVLQFQRVTNGEYQINH